MSQRDPAQLWKAWAEAAREATPPVDVARGRQRLIEAQRELAPRARARMHLRMWMTASAFAVLLMIVRFVWLRPITFESAGVRAEPGGFLATDGGGELPLRFSEGTVVVLASDSRGRVDELRARGARLVLERGTLRAQVTHRLRSDWRFVAGPFEVAVTGTALAIDWDPVRERFSTTVTEGSVKVMGPSVGSEVTVREGERCDVDLRTHALRVGRLTESRPSPPSLSPEPEPESEPETVPETVPAPAPAPRPAKHPVPTPTAPSTVRWPLLEEQGRYDEALAVVARDGIDATIAGANDDELLRLARLMRAAGKPEVAQRALMACRARFPHTANADVAAFELGRTAAPPAAARWFAAYLEEQPDGPLAEQASGRLIEALELSGRHADAVAAAQRLLLRFPDGPYASMARRTISSPTISSPTK